MKAKILLNQPLTQDRYGLHFEKGEALCENEYIIKKLQSKGVKVEVIEEESQEKTIDEMTVVELKRYATEKNIVIPSNVKNKTDITEFINNYKEDNEKTEVSQEDDNEDENSSVVSNEITGEDNNEENSEEEQKAE